MKRFTLVPRILLGFGLFSSACSQLESPKAHLSEAADSNSDFARLKLRKALSYDEISAVKSVKKPTLPWTDTYWPLNEKSVARRWDSSSDSMSFANFLSSQLQAAKDKAVNPLLSPADKYDILYRWRHGRTLDETEFQAKVDSFASIENKLDLNAELSINRSLMKDTHKLLRSGSMESLRQDFPLSSDSFLSYLQYAANDSYSLLNLPNSGEDWSWMGSCHGWAPAALMEETPKHSVMVKFDEQEVLLSEGDIRGLLTKAWADHSPSEEQFFLGRRCEENMAKVTGEIPHGEKGKGFYGEIKRADGKSGFYVRSELFLPYLNGSQRVYPVNYGDNDEVQGYLIESYKGSRSYNYVLVQDLDSVAKYVQKTGDVAFEVIPEVKMYGCWDVNPAAYHIALMEKIGKDGVGLVMDRTRTGQVWNQPVFAADFNIGALKSIEEVLNSNKRAAGTRYVAEVRTVVKWVGEPSVPHMSYTAEFDQQHVKESVYTYVLEFDRNKRVIGGEWGTLLKTDPSQVTPDFIYGFTKGSKPKDDLTQGFDYSGILSQIHACSLTKETDGEAKVEGRSYPYKSCALTKKNP